jgi:hypothetical protein
MTGVGLAELVVEVLHNKGTAAEPDWSVGSGYVLGSRLVLTAAHNVGPGELLVRLHAVRSIRRRYGCEAMSRRWI